MKASEPNN